MKIKRKRLIWDEMLGVADLKQYNIYAADSAVAAFSDAVDAGTTPRLDVVAAVVGTAPSYVISPNDKLTDGTRQFVVTAEDLAGNESDPLQEEAWKLVFLDRTAPPAPTGGSVESF